MRIEDIEESNIAPSHITLHQKSNVLEVGFVDGCVFNFPAEYLRVYSPSAEVRGHSAAQAVLQSGKQSVRIEKVEPVGQYAIKLFFSDGHNTGLFSWKYLYDIGQKQDLYWQTYLDALSNAGKSREASK